MTTLGRHPWRFVSVSLGFDFYVDVPGEPHWTRPERARLAEDPCDGPPTVITRGGALGRRQLPVRLYLPSDGDLTASLATVKAAIQARGPFTLTTHRPWDAPSVVFAPTGQGVEEVDESNAISVNVLLAEVASTAPTATLTSTAASIATGTNTLLVQWANWTAPTWADFIGLYLATDPVTTPIADATVSLLTGGVAFGSAAFTNIGAAPGAYELRGVYGPVPTVVIGPAITITA